MALTDAGAATTLAAATAKTLSGTYKIKANGIAAGHKVVIYEETNTADEYDVALDEGKPMELTEENPVANFELYGNYKFVKTNPNIEVGYAA